MSAKKSRFDGLDVAAMTSHLKRTMLGFKLANVYDGHALGVGGTAGGGSGDGGGSKAVYVFKLANPSGGGGSGSSPANAAPDAPDAPTAAANDGSSSSCGEEGVDSAAKETTVERVTAAEQDEKRAMLLIESGVRFHPTTHYSQSNSGPSSMPSPFAMKLRKHLRNLRLENVTQLGRLDRVVDFRFGSGGRAHHLVLELYAQGNLILCDGEYRILGLLRTHEYEVKGDDDGGAGEEKKDDGKKDDGGKEEVKVRVGNIYPVTFATTLTAVVDSGDSTAGDDDGSNSKGEKEAATKKKADGLLSMDATTAYEWAKAELLSVQQRALAVNSEMQNPNNDPKGGKAKKKGGKKKKAMDEFVVLKALLLKPNSGVYHYGPSLIEHCVRTAGLDPVVKLSCDNIEHTLPEASWNGLITSLRDEGSRVIGNLTSGEGGAGYVLYKPKAAADNAAAAKADKNDKNSDSLLPPTMAADQNPHSDKTLLEFQPHLLLQHRNQPCLGYASFAVAADEFFSHLSHQRVAARADAAEAAARERLARIRADQVGRAAGLSEEQGRWGDAARLVEAHAGDVDRALGVITSALGSGMDWEALERLVAVERGNENPIALLIAGLALDRDEATLSLPDVEGWDAGPDGDAPPPMRNVTVSINESAHGNARNMFANYRASKEKEAKTMEASVTALKAAEAKARAQLAEAQKRKARVAVLPQRRSYWFEKFAWCVTSDNYLVVGGRDAQQNEQLVKRYLRPGDAYLHAEVHGAATCVLRAKRRRRKKDGRTQVIPLSDRALAEAGSFTICRSSAWSSKMVTSAYWVESHQVSKTAPTGEYLTVGSFMIRGRKNFLPASSLEMGLGVLFRLGDEASVARHANERRDFALLEQEQILEEKEKEEMSREGEKEEPAASPLLKSESGDDSEIGVENLSTEEGVGVGVEEQVDEEVTDPTAGNEESKQMSSPDVDKLEQNETSKPEEKQKQVSFDTKNDGPPPPPKTNKEKKKEKELSRGKRSKNKRAKKKYAEQDDEDRELAMMALQGGESQSSAKKGKRGKGSKIVAVESETQQKAAVQTVALLVRDSKKVAEETLDAEVQRVLARCVTVKTAIGSDDGIRWSKLDAEVLEQLGAMDALEEQLAAANRLLELSNTTRVDNFSASLAGIIRAIKKHGMAIQDRSEQQAGGVGGKQGRKSKAEKQAEKEAWREILAEDGIVENEGDDDEGGAVDDTAELDKLTGKPAAQDVILLAIPVCAPYSVVSQYKYRVKLTPGSVKRGKASKQAVAMFLQGGDSGGKKSKQVVDEGTKRDQALIKLVNDNEWVQAMIGDVRITSAGASKVTKKYKGKGKSKK